MNKALDITLCEISSHKDFWYLKKLQEDENTMNYNAGYDIAVKGYHYDTGCIDLPENSWETKFKSNKDRGIYISYIKDMRIDEYVGYVTYHFNKEKNRYYCGILIEDKYRGKGYSSYGLDLLIDVARKNNIKTLYDSFEESRLEALTLFTKKGFKQIGTEYIVKFSKKEKVIVLKLDL